MDTKGGEMSDNKLTFNDAANIYDRYHKGAGRPARTLPMDTVLDWLESSSLVYTDADGFYYLKEDDKDEK
jgi:hypothetical protein